MSPYQFLLLMVMLTVFVAAGRRLFLRTRQRRFREMARHWDMHYAPGDRLRLAARVAENFPLLGACDVRVRDLMFRTTGNVHQYLFTIEYGTGVIRGKRRLCRVGGFAEPVTRGHVVGDNCNLRLGPEELSLGAQYEKVFEILLPESGAVTSDKVTK